MPCASVSENPTRVRAEYLNGGLRSLTRPSSSVIDRDAKRRQSRALGAVAHRLRYGPRAETQDGRSQQPERHDQVCGADPALAGWSRAVSAGLRAEVVQSSDLGLVRLQRREGRDRHERVDQPVAAHVVDVDLEHDRAELRVREWWLQHHVRADLVALDVVERPRVVLAARGVRIDADVAAGPLLLAHAAAELTVDDTVGGAGVLALDRVVDEDVDRPTDLLSVARTQLGGSVRRHGEQEGHESRKRKEDPGPHTPQSSRARRA